MYVHAAKKGHRIVNVDVEGVFAGAEERGSGVGERRESSNLGVVNLRHRDGRRGGDSLTVEKGFQIYSVQNAARVDGGRRLM